MNLGTLLSRRWWKTTILVLAAVAVMIRLGIWQLDRLEQRKEFNSRVEAQLAEPVLVLSGDTLESDLYAMEYRSTVISGEYDHQRQVVLRNQDWNGRLGVHILTPLLVAGEGAAVLVDRGWVPYEDYTAGNLAMYDQPGQVQIEGVIRRSQSKSALGGRADRVPGPGDPPLEIWNWINLEDISGQIPYQLLPVYIAALPGADSQELPYRAELELDLSEGPHLGYAFQWFIFASILGIGYPFFVRREEGRRPVEEIQKKNNPQPGQVPVQAPDTDSKGYEQA